MKQPTQEMINFFEDRTQKHIYRVIKNMEKVAINNPNATKILKRAKDHDQSKYDDTERIPYIWLTEFYRCKNNDIDFTYPEGVEEVVNQASNHHVSVNLHHPEAHKDPNDMSDIDIIEMVCDWAAMSQESNQDGGSAKGWADKNVGSKWKFNEQKKALIYDTIESLDYWNSTGGKKEK